MDALRRRDNSLTFSRVTRWRCYTVERFRRLLVRGNGSWNTWHLYMILGCCSILCVKLFPEINLIQTWRSFTRPTVSHDANFLTQFYRHNVSSFCRAVQCNVFYEYHRYAQNWRKHDSLSVRVRTVHVSSNEQGTNPRECIHIMFNSTRTRTTTFK